MTFFFFFFLPNSEQRDTLQLTLHQNAFTVNTHDMETIITVHTPMSQEGIILCAQPVLCICSVLHIPPPLSQMHTQTHTKRHTSATEPQKLSSVTHSFFFFFLPLCRETPPPFHCDTGRSHGVSPSCTFYLFQSCFYHLGRHLSVNSAQLFPPQLI